MRNGLDFDYLIGDNDIAKRQANHLRRKPTIELVRNSTKTKKIDNVGLLEK